MKKSLIFLCLMLIGLFFVNADAQLKHPKKNYEPLTIEQSPELQMMLTNAVDATINGFMPKKINPDFIAATLIDLRDAENLRMANYRGNQPIYPASVVKMFYMTMLEQWLENGKVKLRTLNSTTIT